MKGHVHVQYLYFSAIEEFILVASEHNVRGIPLDSESTSYYTDAITPVVGVDSTFVAVDYDAQDEYIYYSDVRKDTIMRVKGDGTGRHNYRIPPNISPPSNTSVH